jgi:hypothetical protein
LPLIMVSMRRFRPVWGRSAASQVFDDEVLNLRIDHIPLPGRYAWVLGIVLLILTPACALSSLLGGDSGAPGQEQTAAPTATSITLTATPLPSASPTTTSTSTPVPPTRAPASPVQTPTSAPSYTRVTSQATGACNNAYYPVRSDTTWHYQIQRGDAPPTDYAVTYDHIQADSFTARQIFPDQTRESLWRCTDEGLIPSDVSSFMFVQIASLEFETLDYSGVYLPPADEWAVGATWETTYTVKATTKVLGISVVSQAEVRVHNRIAAAEGVSVPAGTYSNAMRINSTATALVHSGGSDIRIDVAFSHWYVKDVGLVKAESDDPATDFVMELVSIDETPAAK